jgi:hypothetical protein
MDFPHAGAYCKSPETSEAMTSSLTVYDYVKTAAKSKPGLRAVADQLGDRFKASRAKATQEVSLS